MAESGLSSKGGKLYLWLDGDPGATPADVAIEDVPGVSDIDLIVEGIVSGKVGRYLPVALRYADHPTPHPGRVRSLDVAKLLRDRHIRHRRRYEVLLEALTDSG